MNRETLVKMIEGGESEKIEFKKSTSQLEKALRTVCGFLNHKGGRVYFGVDNGKIVGQDVSDNTLRSVSQKIRQRIKPEVSPEIKVLEIEDKKLIEVKVEGGNNKPYYLDGIAYKRVGTENVVIPPEELERIILEKKKRYFDSEICEEASLNDIDEEKVKEFVKEAKRQRGLDLSETLSIKEILMRLKLLKNDKPINTAILLFSKNPQNFFLQAEVKCIRFKGIDVTGDMLDFKTIGGDTISQLRKAEDFIFEHIPMKAWIEEGKLQRQEKWLYPQKAIREVLANALAHRDYESPSKAQVRIFDDRMEFWNPGRLPPELSLEDLKKKHKSIPRNPLIAKQFFWIKYIEEVGTGTNKIVDWCVNWGLPEPEFEHVTGDFVVTFWKSKLADEYLDSLGLNDRQRKAISYLKEHGKIMKKEYMNLSKISKTAAFKDISDLLDKNIIMRIGSGRSAYYVLQEKVLKRPKNDHKMTINLKNCRGEDVN